MKIRKNAEPKEICLALMLADHQEDIIQILQTVGYWDDAQSWRYYGDRASNINTIGNQQSRPDAAIVEKLVNSVDARLINECLLHGIDPEGSAAPKSIREAVALFFDAGAKAASAGLIREWTPKKRTEVAQGITLAATGNKPGAGEPCFIISDLGEGQTPLALPNTILSLDKENKVKIPFVQGKFNMGGTGVLEFCGANNFQFVLSRRNPALIKSKGDPTSHHWGFTVVRREDPIGGRRSSVYTYLAPIGADILPNKGQVLSFDSKSMPIFPDGQDAYGRSAEWGTFIKLYEYSTSGFSGTNILLDSGLLRQLDLLLTDLALPIRLYECRNYSGKKGSFSTNLTGIAVRLEDDKGENLEQEPESVSMKIDGEKMTANIFVFKKEKDKIYRSDEGIIFSVNGQSHGHLSKSFFRRKSVGMSYLADSILVTIDCTYISSRARELLFMPSRDRLRSGALKSGVENALEDLIGNNPNLRNLRAKRRQEEIEAILDDQRPLGDILENLIKDSPTLAALFLKGTRLSNPFDNSEGTEDSSSSFTGKRFPSFFKFEDRDYGEVLTRNCHINKRARITFETDVENNYFSRTPHQGKFTLQLLNVGESIEVDHTLNLRFGIASLNIRLPISTKVGDRLAFEARVTDDTGSGPFVNKFDLIILGEGETKPGGPGPRRNPPKGDKGKRKSPSGFNLPNIIKVAKEADNAHRGWANMSPPFDEYSAVRIVHADRISTEDASSEMPKDVYDFYINVDNIFLRHEQKNRKTDPEILLTKYLYAQVLLGIGLLNYDNQSNSPRVETEFSVEEQVERFSVAVSPVIIPILTDVGGINLDDV